MPGPPVFDSVLLPLPALHRCIEGSQDVQELPAPPVFNATPLPLPALSGLIIAPPISRLPHVALLSMLPRALSLFPCALSMLPRAAQFHHPRNTQPPNCVASIPSYHVFSLYVIPHGWPFPNSNSSLKKNLQLCSSLIASLNSNRLELSSSRKQANKASFGWVQ